MSLKRWTFLLIAGTTLFLISATLAITIRTLNLHYQNQEKISVSLNIKRILGAIDQQFFFLEKTSNDWAVWDDTYQFVQDQNPEYIAQNLQPLTFHNLGIDLMILVAPDARIAYSGIVEPNDTLSTAIPAALKDHLQPSAAILNVPAGQNASHGLLQINGQPMLIISHPILNTDQSSPVGGTLLIGKYLSQELINNIGSLLLLTIQSMPIYSVQKNPEYTPVLQYQPTEAEPYFIRMNPEQVYGYTILNDFFDQPILIIKIEQFASISNNGRVVNNFLAASLIVTALAFSIMLYILIQFNVLNRISRLSKEVATIGVSGDIHRRLTVTFKDELSSLAETINSTLNALDQAIFQRQETEERFRTLVESMEDVVFTVDLKDQQVQVYAKDTRTTPDAFIPLHQPSELELNLGQQIAGQPLLLQQVAHGHSAEFEWTNQAPGATNYYIATLSPIYAAQGSVTHLVGVSKDITRQKQLEQNLRKRVDELGALFSISQQLLNQVQIETTRQTICELALAPLEMQAAWILTPSPDESVLVPAVSAGVSRSSLREIAIYPAEKTQGHPAAQALTSMEMEVAALPHPDVLEQWPEQDESRTILALPLMNANQVLSVLVMVMKTPTPLDADTLTLIRAFMNLCSVAIQNAFLFHQVDSGRDRLQAVSKRLVEVQEEERRRIALELHDEIGQVLTGLRFSIEMIKTMPPEALEQQVLVSTEIVNELIGRVRQLSLDLRPSMLDDLGLVQTLRWFFDRYTQQTGIQVDFPPNNLGLRRLAPNLEITSYRIVQEALTNVARHAKVKRVTVRLWCTEKILGIQVDDQGVGFNVDAVFNAPQSKGLLGMWERIAYIGGQMDIISEPGEGTSLTAQIPLEGLIERRKHAR